MKQAIKIYLDSDTKRKLAQKAGETGFEGRGALTKFIEKVASEDICFLDDNVKKMLKVVFPAKE